jgi:hypothetical protein
LILMPFLLVPFVMALNLDPQRDADVCFPGLDGRGYALYRITAPDVLRRRVLLTGTELKIGTDGVLPKTQRECQQGDGAPSVRLHRCHMRLWLASATPPRAFAAPRPCSGPESRVLCPYQPKN